MVKEAVECGKSLMVLEIITYLRSKGHQAIAIDIAETYTGDEELVRVLKAELL